MSRYCRLQQEPRRRKRLQEMDRAAGAKLPRNQGSSTRPAKKGTIALNASGPDGSPVRLHTHSVEADAYAVWTSTLILRDRDELPLRREFLTMVQKALDADPAWDSQIAPTLTPRQIDVYERCGKTKARFLLALRSDTGKYKPVSLIKQGEDATLVLKENPVQECDDCHVRYVNKHACNVRTLAFVNNIVDRNNYMYKNIRFFPPTSPDTARTIWIVYDMETFTKHTKLGKQLKPFLIAFTVRCGDARLSEKVLAAIRDDHPWYRSKDVRDVTVYYDLDTDSVGLCQRFNKLRKHVSLLVLEECWKSFLLENPHVDPKIADHRELHKIAKTLNSGGSMHLYEVVVIGHNISAFDEILTWGHMIDWVDIRASYPQFRWKRLFLPRAGKILFNDTYATLPNPSYVKPDKQVYSRWSRGTVESRRDLKNQGVFFRVRDTYLLTHTSLRNAAHAYGLKVHKGSCPYTAVNEYLMTGKYKCDSRGYPDLKYWKDEAEYKENEPGPDAKYDIIGETVDYCIQDVVVTLNLANTLETAYGQFFNSAVGPGRFDVFKRPTVSSNTHALFKQIAYKNQNSHNSDVFNDIIAPSGEGYDHVRDSIRGGRCYPTYLGVFAKPIYVYDICGMYASALTHPMPSGKLCNKLKSAFFMDKLQQKLGRPDDVIDYFDRDVKPIIAYADCYPPPLERLDVLPPMGSKRSGQLIWTNEAIVGEIMTTVDLITLHNRGWDCKILTDRPYMVWQAWKCVCSDYVKINIEAKEKASKEGNETLRSLSKLLSNALYGSFATRLDTKKVIVGCDLEDEEDEDALGEDLSNVITTVLIPDHLPYTEIDLSETLVSNLPENDSARDAAKINDGRPSDNQNILRAVDHDDEMLTVYTVNKGDLVDNDRYATHIASYVLAWTRAFISEWADFIYAEDRGTPIEDREIASVYGDTDSLFLTELGRQRLLKNGSHRIKTAGSRLTFDPERPDLTWAVECETVCPTCKDDAFSPESIFIAPKLYALKHIECKKGHVHKGKIRAKGHDKSSIDYETLKKCFMWTYMRTAGPRDGEEYNTERTTIKKTLIRGDSRNAPMTVKEKTLIRILRPWKNKRLRDVAQNDEDSIYTNKYGIGQILVPFDSSHPYQPDASVPIVHTIEEWPEPSSS
uniref:DNA polymerase n=1 Tax=Adenoviridae sp. TaxID=2558248 RepID=A0A7D5U5X6_9ADEN|nr:MAG: polyprotein [Adenoviridae sp.]